MSLQITPKPSRQYPQEQRLADALSALLRRIEVGEEFPDACWRVAARHNVKYEHLQSAYDDHHATE